jgi:hypothetical protein
MNTVFSEIVIKSATGNTPGHQILYLKLAKTGSVVLSDDLHHYPEERAWIVCRPSSSIESRHARREWRSKPAFQRARAIGATLPTALGFNRCQVLPSSGRAFLFENGKPPNESKRN